MQLKTINHNFKKNNVKKFGVKCKLSVIVQLEVKYWLHFVRLVYCSHIIVMLSHIIVYHFIVMLH